MRLLYILKHVAFACGLVSMHSSSHDYSLSSPWGMTWQTSSMFIARFCRIVSHVVFRSLCLLSLFLAFSSSSFNYKAYTDRQIEVWKKYRRAQCLLIEGKPIELDLERRGKSNHLVKDQLRSISSPGERIQYNPQYPIIKVRLGEIKCTMILIQGWNDSI